jgi:hypothetical protein
MNTTQFSNPALETFRKAEAAIKDGNDRNLSDRTMAKRWKAFFAAEDALKAATWSFVR